MADPDGVGLVLAGGAAHGAYEVGVLRAIFEDLGPDLEVPPRFDVLCGTSIGALNACALAAAADAPAAGVARLAHAWSSLRLSDVLRFSARGAIAMARSLVGGSQPRRAGLFSAAPLRRLLTELVPFERIPARLAAGDLRALAIAATRVATGQTVVFTEQHAAPRLLPDDLPLRPTRIEADHVIASAAVPLLFPPVELDGQLYCDGGLRQMLPLAPALHLGAAALVVVNPRHPPEDEPASIGRARERAYGSPVFLLGRTLDVLLVDRVQDDLERLRHVNAIVEAGTRRYGPGFAAELSRELVTGGRRPVRAVDTVEIRSSLDLARLAADHVRSARFRRQAGRVHAGLFRLLAEAEGARETTFLSYLLFDGEFARVLMELGRKDALARRDELVATLQRSPARRAAGRDGRPS